MSILEIRNLEIESLKKQVKSLSKQRNIFENFISIQSKKEFNEDVIESEKNESNDEKQNEIEKIKTDALKNEQFIDEIYANILEYKIEQLRLDKLIFKEKIKDLECEDSKKEIDELKKEMNQLKEENDKEIEEIKVKYEEGNSKLKNTIQNLKEQINYFKNKKGLESPNVEKKLSPEKEKDLSFVTPEGHRQRKRDFLDENNNDSPISSSFFSTPDHDDKVFKKPLSIPKKRKRNATPNHENKKEPKKKRRKIRQKGKTLTLSNILSVKQNRTPKLKRIFK